MILVDDSIVRGTTASKIVSMVYEAGAKEVHLGITCPPIKFPDYYGIDTPKHKELMASNYTLNEMTRIVGAKSLFFLSLTGTYIAMGYENRDNKNPQFSDHCFTGDYPIDIEEIQNLKNELFD